MLLLALPALIAASAAPTGTAGTAGTARAEPPPTVLMISLDGTSPEAVRTAPMPRLLQLAERGLAADRMEPVLPTNTFPNHVTLVTGVRPEKHGVVNNVFFDAERGLHSYDGAPDWIEVEPLWSLVARSGIVSAAFHWVGSEGPWRSGLGPRHWEPFDARVDEEAKVDRILAWLDLADPAERPRLVTSWFRGADAASHRHGPGSAQAREALVRQDRALGRLVEGLEARGLFESVTLLVVSDHGMAEVERVVDLQSALEDAGVAARVLGAGGFVTLHLERSAGAQLPRALDVARRLGLEAWSTLASPDGLPVRHARFGDAVVIAPVGTAIAKRGAWSRLRAALGGRPGPRGVHGYRPEEPSMGALFVAAGRGVPVGTRRPRVRTVDVMPTVLRLLGVPVPEGLEGQPIEPIGRMQGGAR